MKVLTNIAIGILLISPQVLNAGIDWDLDGSPLRPHHVRENSKDQKAQNQEKLQELLSAGPEHIDPRQLEHLSYDLDASEYPSFFKALLPVFKDPRTSDRVKIEIMSMSSLTIEHPESKKYFDQIVSLATQDASAELRYESLHYAPVALKSPKFFLESIDSPDLNTRILASHALKEYIAHFPENSEESVFQMKGILNELQTRVTKYLSSSKIEDQVVIADWLYMAPEAQGIMVLRNLLNPENPPAARERAANALSEQGLYVRDKSHHELATNYARSKQKGYLGASAHERSFGDLILRAAQDPDPLVKAAGIKALAFDNSAEAAKIIQEIRLDSSLKKSDARSWRAISKYAYQWIELHGADHPDLLLELWHSKEGSNRRLALNMLNKAQITTPEEKQILIEALRDKDFRLEALGIWSRSPHSSDREKALFEKYKNTYMSGSPEHENYKQHLTNQEKTSTALARDVSASLEGKPIQVEYTLQRCERYLGKLFE